MNKLSEKSNWVVAGLVAGGAIFGYSIRLIHEQLLKNKLRNKNQQAESHLWKIVEYSLSSTMIRVADRLDLFELLYRSGPVTSQKLAASCQWSERWLREVLLQLAGSGICTYDHVEKTFAIKAEYAQFLRGPEYEKKSIAGMFHFLAALVHRGDTVVNAVQTGRGIDYDYGMEDIGTALDRKNGNFFRYTLVNEVIKNMKIPSTGESLYQKLVRGLAVADVGCGFGTSTIVMAKRFPKSRFYAFESSPRALQSMKENVEKEKISNVTICDVVERTIGDGPDLDDPSSVFGFVYAHDVLHDMLNPKELIKDVKKRLAQDGIWFIVDIDCSEKIEENLRLPNAPMLYAFSCLLCLSMATSGPNGEGLGTCGFPPKVAENWMRNAGFKYFEKTKIQSLPYNACYTVA